MNDLHLLIQSLSPNEKRYVSIYINKFSSAKNNYSILYECIEKQTKYNEAEIVKKLRKESFVKHLAVTKHYLYDLILNAMREYYDEHFLDWKLKKQAQQVFVLTSKGLDRAGHRLLLKVKELAWQYENYYVLLDMLNHEKWLFGNRRIETRQLDFGITICKEEQRALQYLTKIQDYKSVWHQLTYYELNQKEYTSNTYTEHLGQCIDTPLMQQEIIQDSYLISTWYHSVWAHYYMLSADAHKHFIHYKKVVEIREQQLQAQPEAPIDLLATYYNFMLACYQNKQWDDLHTYLQKIQKLDTKSIERKIKFFHDYYHSALLYYLGTHQYAEGHLLILEIVEGLNAYQSRIRIDFLIWIWQCMGLICFFNKDYKQAHHWWMQIVQLEKTEIEIKIQCSVELYMLMLAIEEGNLDVFDYQIKQAYNRVKENNLLDDNVTAWMDFCKNIVKNGKAHIKDFLALQHQITYTKHSILDDFMLQWINIRAAK